MLSPDKGEHKGFLLCIVVYKRLAVNRIFLEKTARTILEKKKDQRATQAL